LTDLAKGVSGPEPPATTSLMESLTAVSEGDAGRAASAARRAVEQAREEGDPIQLVWILATCAIVEAMHGSDRALPVAEEALAIAHRHGGTVIRLQPLKAVMGAAANTDPARVLEAAEETARIDRTRRQASARVARMLAARTRVTHGDIAEGLTEWRDIVSSYHDDGQRTDLALSLVALAGTLARIDSLLAVEIAAIAESDAIAPVGAFVTPDLAPLVDELATEIDAARNRAATMSYDVALAFVFDAIDRLISVHDPPGSVAPTT
jgi:hypothetical protein